MHVRTWKGARARRVEHGPSFLARPISCVLDFPLLTRIKLLCLTLAPRWEWGEKEIRKGGEAYIQHFLLVTFSHSFLVVVLLTGICSLAYFGVSAILTLMWPYSTLPDGGTLPKIFALKGAPWAQYVIAVGALCGLTSSLLGCLLPLPRMLYSMGSDGIIFK